MSAAVLLRRESVVACKFGPRYREIKGAIHVRWWTPQPDDTTCQMLGPAVLYPEYFAQLIKIQRDPQTFWLDSLADGRNENGLKLRRITQV